MLPGPASSSTTGTATPRASRWPGWWGRSPPLSPAGPSWTSSRTPTVTLLSGSFWCGECSECSKYCFFFLQAVAASQSWLRWRVSTSPVSRESSTRWYNNSNNLSPSHHPNNLQLKCFHLSKAQQCDIITDFLDECTSGILGKTQSCS